MASSEPTEKRITSPRLRPPPEVLLIILIARLVDFLFANFLGTVNSFVVFKVVDCSAEAAFADLDVVIASFLKDLTVIIELSLHVIEVGAVFACGLWVKEIHIWSV